MPLFSFSDYESDLLHSAQPQDKQRKSGDAPVYSRNNSSYTSGPTSASTTMSSVISSADKSSATPVASTYNPPASRRQQQSNNPGAAAAKHNMSLNLAGMNQTIKCASNGDTFGPTSPIQEWAHLTHLQQRRAYSWCSQCCPPRMKSLHIPSEKVMKRVRVQEPTHAYQ